MKPKKENVKYVEKAQQDAMELYCLVDENGNKKYTLPEIAEIISKKHSKIYSKRKLSKKVVSDWKIKFHWDDTFIKIKQHGLMLATESFAKKESSLMDKKSDLIKMIYEGDLMRYDLTKGAFEAKFKNKNIFKNEAGDTLVVPEDLQWTDINKAWDASRKGLLELNNIDSGINLDDLSDEDLDKLIEKLG